MSTKPIVFLVTVAYFAGAFAVSIAGEGPADEVNPFIGCSYNGHCYAAAAYPFALDATGLVGQYAHGNEPSHHTIYLFQYAGRPDRTAELVREVCDRFYRPEPEGQCGNDDCGQMSAWYLFSAMGFYPLNPCGGDYMLGAPQVPKVVIHPGGSRSCATADAMNCVPPRTFTIVAKNLSKENKYVKSVMLNGKPLVGHGILDVPILRHANIMRGGELVFEMTATP